MTNNSVAYPYARSLYEIAKNENKIDEWLSILKKLSEVSKAPDFIAIINNPKIEAQKIIEVLLGCVNSSHMQLKAFLELLNSNNRFGILAEIFMAFEKMFEEDAKVATAIIESAFPMKSEDREQIEKILSIKFGKTINADVTINSNLIGGIKIIIDDVVIDASIMGSLNKMATQLKR